MTYSSEQEIFWSQNYAFDYISKNTNFDNENGILAWRKILLNTTPLESILECGSNIGRNINFLNTVCPLSKKSIIELSQPAFDYVTSNYSIHNSFKGSILNSNFENNNFDMVFTMGVLIHIHPDNLHENMLKIYNYSKKYILIGEYFNKTPIMIEYQGQKDKLFKRDFGKFFIDNFNVKLIDYGFLWGYIFDNAGFDDITWWLFEKK